MLQHTLMVEQWEVRLLWHHGICFRQIVVYGKNALVGMQEHIILAQYTTHLNIYLIIYFNKHMVWEII